MVLKMRPTALGHGVYKDVPDYGIFCGEWCVGRIYKTRTGPTEAPLVLGAPCSEQTRNASHRQPRGYAGESQGRIRGELESVEGVGGNGRGRIEIATPVTRSGHPDSC